MPTIKAVAKTPAVKPSAMASMMTRLLILFLQTFRHAIENIISFSFLVRG
jgi:hypothetical protein